MELLKSIIITPVLIKLMPYIKAPEASIKNISNKKIFKPEKATGPGPFKSH